METFILKEDIRLFCVTASSFPEGVMAAHEKVHQLAPQNNGRKFFGLSRPEGGKGIVYKAAAEEMTSGEGEKLGLEPFVIRKGIYTSTVLKDFMSNLPAVGQTFQQLLTNPNLDPNGMCVEEYLNDTDMRCMVRLADNQ